jgi:hypothetical protein
MKTVYIIDSYSETSETQTLDRWDLEGQDT